MCSSSHSRSHKGIFTDSRNSQYILSRDHFVCLYVHFFFSHRHHRRVLLLFLYFLFWLLFYTEKHSFVHCLINVVSVAASAMGERERASSILFFYRGYGIMHLATDQGEGESERISRESRHKPQKTYCVISRKWFFEFWKGIKCAIKTLNGIFIEILLRN